MNTFGRIPWLNYMKIGCEAGTERVLEMLAQCAGSEDGKLACQNLRPSSDLETVQELQRQTTAACTMSAVQGSPSFCDVKNVNDSLERADRAAVLARWSFCELRAFCAAPGW